MDCQRLCRHTSSGCTLLCVQYLRSMEDIKELLSQPLPSSMQAFTARQLDAATADWAQSLKSPAHEAFGLMAWEAPSLHSVVQVEPVHSLSGKSPCQSAQIGWGGPRMRHCPTADCEPCWEQL